MPLDAERDVEIEAIRQIVVAMNPLDEKARRRVIRYLWDREYRKGKVALQQEA